MRLCEGCECFEDVADWIGTFCAVEKEDSFAGFEELWFARFDDFGGAGVAGLDFAEEGHCCGALRGGRVGDWRGRGDLVSARWDEFRELFSRLVPALGLSIRGTLNLVRTSMIFVPSYLASGLDTKSGTGKSPGITKGDQMFY